MLAILHLLGTFVANLFRSRRRLEVENLFLRHQLNIAMRRAPRRLRLLDSDRAVLVWLTWLWPSLIGLARVVQPDTILRWHRSGFRAYWRWKSCGQPGRPRVSRELRDLIRQMSIFVLPSFPLKINQVDRSRTRKTSVLALVCCSRAREKNSRRNQDEVLRDNPNSWA